MLRQQLGDAAGELQALEGLGRVTRHHVNEPALTLDYCEHALTLARSLGDRAAQGRLHNTMGILEWNRGGFHEALDHYEAGLALYLDAGDAAGAGLMRNSIGATYLSLGRSDQAFACLTDAVESHRRTAQPLLEGHALGLLAELCEARGDMDRAHDCYAQSLALRRTLKDRRGEGWMLCGLGRVHIARGDAEAARAAELQAAAIATDCNDPALAAACERLRRAPGP
jgi:tetratricopeptide (TPR) repeat protein